MTPVPVRLLQTMGDPHLYSEAQLFMAAWMARCLNSGRFVLCEPPANE